MRHDYIQFSGPNSIIRMILNPSEFLEKRLDRAVDLSLVRVKFPVPKDCADVHVVPHEIKYPTEDKDVISLLRALKLKPLHPKSLAVSYKKRPDPELFSLVTFGSDESGYYFGGRSYSAVLTKEDSHVVVKTQFRHGSWPAGTRFACQKK